MSNKNRRLHRHNHNQYTRGSKRSTSAATATTTGADSSNMVMIHRDNLRWLIEQTMPKTEEQQRLNDIANGRVSMTFEEFFEKDVNFNSVVNSSIKLAQELLHVRALLKEKEQILSRKEEFINSLLKELQSREGSLIPT